MQFDLPTLPVVTLAKEGYAAEPTSPKAQTVAQIVADNPRAANVFKKYGLDFCCGGKKPLEAACAEMGLDPAAVHRDLTELPATGDLPSQDYRRWDAAFLTEFIVQTHHRYLRAELPVLLEMVDKVVRSHGDRYPEMREAFEVFVALKDEVEAHLEQEECMLFPYITQLATAARTGEKPSAPSFGSVENPIARMEDEHDAVGELLRRLSALTAGYQPPAGACNTYRATLAKLHDLEQDLHRHIFLENTVLFPKALALETTWMAHN